MSFIDLYANIIIFYSYFLITQKLSLQQEVHFFFQNTNERQHMQQLNPIAIKLYLESIEMPKIEEMPKLS